MYFVPVDSYLGPTSANLVQTVHGTNIFDSQVDSMPAFMGPGRQIRFESTGRVVVVMAVAGRFGGRERWEFNDLRLTFGLHSRQDSLV